MRFPMQRKDLAERTAPAARITATRTRTKSHIDGACEVEKKTPLELFCDLYELQNNTPPTDEQREIIDGLIKAATSLKAKYPSPLATL